MLYEKQLVECTGEERPVGGTEQGEEVGEMVAFRYLKGLESEKRILAHAKR